MPPKSYSTARRWQSAKSNAGGCACRATTTSKRLSAKVSTTRRNSGDCNGRSTNDLIRQPNDSTTSTAESTCLSKSDEASASTCRNACSTTTNCSTHAAKSAAFATSSATTTANSLPPLPATAPRHDFCNMPTQTACILLLWANFGGVARRKTTSDTIAASIRRAAASASRFSDLCCKVLTLSQIPTNENPSANVRPSTKTDGCGLSTSRRACSACPDVSKPTA